VLLSELEPHNRREQVRFIFAKAHLYTEDELCNCVGTLDYPDTFWYILEGNPAPFIRFPKLWTDPETECFHNLRTILLQDERRYKHVAHRFVQHVYPQSQCIPDFTFENIFMVLRKPPADAERYLATIMPKTRGYIEMKKAEYLEIMRTAGLEAEGARLAEQLMRTQYHPAVAGYIWWPASRSLLTALLRQRLELRKQIFGANDCGWVPEGYIDICRSPLAWEADEVRAYTETGACPSGNAHAGDVRV
jgi:hypothetical protein